MEIETSTIKEKTHTKKTDIAGTQVATVAAAAAAKNIVTNDQEQQQKNKKIMK